MNRTLHSFTHALVRPPGACYVSAIAEFPQPIDVELAQKQHAEYVSALRETGVQVEILAASETFPDACFVQDPAMVLDGIAILNRMGAASRLGETDLLADVLRARFETYALTAPATLEGGDVLNCGDRLIVGETARTNYAGIAQLRALVEPRSWRVDATPVGDFLHLLTVVTYVGQGVIVVHEDFAGQELFRAFDKVIVPRNEAYAANTMGIGDFVLMPAGYANTYAQLRARGFQVLQVPMSEFYKADGGISCLALVW